MSAGQVSPLSDLHIEAFVASRIFRWEGWLFRVQHSRAGGLVCSSDKFQEIPPYASEKSNYSLWYFSPGPTSAQIGDPHVSAGLTIVLYSIFNLKIWLPTLIKLV